MVPKVFLFNSSRIDYQWSSYGLIFSPGIWEMPRTCLDEGGSATRLCCKLPAERGEEHWLFDLNPASLASFIMRHQFLKIRLSPRRGQLGSKEPETEQQRECETERSLASL